MELARLSDRLEREGRVGRPPAAQEEGMMAEEEEEARTLLPGGSTSIDIDGVDEVEADGTAGVGHHHASGRREPPSWRIALARASASPAAIHLSLVVAQLNWAMMHILLAPALRSGVDPLVLSTSRECLATIILAACAGWTGTRARGGGECHTDGEEASARVRRSRGGGEGWRTWELIRAGGSLGFALAIMRSSVVVANYYAGPLVTSTLVLTSPVFTFFFSALAGLESIDPRRRSTRLQFLGVLGCVAAAIAMGLTGDPSTRGALLLGQPTGVGHVPRNAALGTAFMLLNTCASALQVVWQRKLIDAGFAPNDLNAVMTGVATLWLLFPTLALKHDAGDWTPTTSFVGAAVYAAVFPSAMNVAIMANANAALGPRVTMLYFVLQPVLTWIADYAFLYDAVYATQVLSAALALGALAVWLVGKNAEAHEQRS